MWFVMAGLLLVRKAFSTAAQVAYTVHIVFNIKTVCLHYVILEMHSFPMSAAKHFYDNPLSIYLDPKIVLFYRPHPVVSEERMWYPRGNVVSEEGCGTLEGGGCFRRKVLVPEEKGLWYLKRGRGTREGEVLPEGVWPEEEGVWYLRRGYGT